MTIVPLGGSDLSFPKSLPEFQRMSCERTPPGRYRFEVEEKR